MDVQKFASRRAMMDWTDLKFFLAFAENGSLANAAKRLGVDHSTVGRRIEALERDLGLRLVDRLPRAYQLTAIGARIVDMAGDVETGVMAIERFARGADPAPSGVVRISAPPALTSHVLTPCMLPLRLQYPELRLELIGEARQVSLSRRDADLALRLFRPRDKGLTARRLATMGFGLYGSRDYLAHHDRDSLDYLGYDESLDHVPQQRWLKAVSGDRPLALRTNDLTTLLTAVRAGLGVAALPHILARGDPTLGVVVAPPAPTRDLWLLFYRDLARSPRIRVVIDHIAAAMALARPAFHGEQDATTL